MLLKDILTSAITPSLESHLDEIEQQIRPLQLQQEAKHFIASLEGIIDYGKSINSNDAVAVDRFQRVADAIVYPTTGQMVGGGDYAASMEGLANILDTIKRAFKRDRPESGKMMDEAKNFREMRPALEKALKEVDQYYLNDQWLKKQSFKEGDVNLGALYGELCIDGKLPEDVAKAYREIMDKALPDLKKYLDAVRDYGKDIDQLNDALAKAAGKVKADDDASIETFEDEVKKAIAAAKKLKLPVERAGLIGVKHTLMGGKVLGFDRNGPSIKGSVSGSGSLPTLDGVGVKALAEQMKRALELYHDKSYFTLAGIYPTDETSAIRTLFGDNVADDAINDWWDQVSFHALDNTGMFDHISMIFDQINIIKAMSVWIEGSIK